MEELYLAWIQHLIDHHPLHWKRRVKYHKKVKNKSFSLFTEFSTIQPSPLLRYGRAHRKCQAEPIFLFLIFIFWPRYSYRQRSANTGALLSLSITENIAHVFWSVLQTGNSECSNTITIPRGTSWSRPAPDAFRQQWLQLYSTSAATAG